LAQAHTNLGLALAAQGRLGEAINAHRQATRLDPKLAQAHTNLGLALAAKGRLGEAINAHRQALRLDPKMAGAHNNLGAALYAQGQLDEAVAAFRQFVRLEPKSPEAHSNLGFALSALGRLDEAVAACRQATRLDPTDARAHGALGDALLKQGKFAEAQAATRRLLDLLPPDHPLRKLGTQQLQQCERWLALEERLPAVLQGRAKPADAAERLALAQLCQQYKQRYAAAARFYVEAFAGRPRLAEDLRAGHRYNAACAAARAGAGKGSDPDGPGDADRVGFRRYALTWLRADLAAWAAAGQGPPQARREVTQALRRWLSDPALAGLRDPQEIAQLPAEERPACHGLWADVAALLRQAEGKQ
jgi:Flp pilus assembly protein TadD